MITIMPIRNIILVIAVVYASVSCVFLWLLYDTSSTSLLNAIGVATSGAIFLNIIIFCFINYYWQFIWKRFPILNTLFFPNLNGKWKMTIHWESGEDKGKSSAVAEIKQSFLNTVMDVEARDSDSYTLMMQAKKDPESGRPLLYYIFQTIPKHIPKNKNPNPYRGSAILQIGLENTNKLSGNYFTSRETKGYFELNRK